jgi:16S rRNA (cytosine967-C5)-methyltransferase
MTDRAPLSREIAIAAAAIEALKGGRALPAALDAALSAAAQGAPALPDASRAAVRDMAHHAARNLGLLEGLAGALNRRPPAPRLAALQAVALSQLLAPLRAEAIIVDQAVEAARAAADTAPAAGFLNATLRRFLREREALIAAARQDPVARWNHPRWWIDRVRHDHPQAWESVLQAADAEPPLTLRVNARCSTVADYLARLEAAGIAAEQIGEQALRLARAVPVGTLPGWSDGAVSVQDAGAQLAAPLLAPRDGERVLDACAGPGGKTTHLLELADCKLTALDLDESRLAPVRENLARLGQHAAVRVGDATQPAGWWDGQRFARILVDAPCTASGIVRRHPDIRWLRQRRDIATLAARQAAILAGLWPLLEAGGRLLYATCSVFALENEAVVGGFLAAHADAARLPLRARLGAADDQPIAQLLPASRPGTDHDGFFYALLEKRP